MEKPMGEEIKGEDEVFGCSTEKTREFMSEGWNANFSLSFLPCR